MPVSRRTFVKGALGASGALVLGPQLRSSGSAAAAAEPATRGVATGLPAPGESGIEHIVVVMMENRSFDHFLGWLPGARGRQAGLAYPDAKGVRHETFHQTQLNGCAYGDQDHSYQGGRQQYNHGKMNGFLADSANDLYAISYYLQSDRPFMGALARNYTTCDSYFCSILGPTYPNRFFQHSAQTDRLSNTSTTSVLPTIWDRLNQGGPTGRYYFNDLPFLALWGTKYLSISEPYEAFLAVAAAGTLPNVSFVDPRFEDEGDGTSNDDHPVADIRAGDALLSQIFHAVATGPQWASTVLVINYDEWGGFFDHVAPPRVTPGLPPGTDPRDGVDRDLVDGRVLLGFRVPCIIASPFTRSSSPDRPRIASGLYDHTSVLKMIEWRWGLRPLSQRDASDRPGDPANLASALDFGRPRTALPEVPDLAPFVPLACGTPVANPESDGWAALRSSAALAGWHL